LKLVVEGWRSLGHSYAIVNQWQLLSLKRRPGVDLRVRDMPFFHPKWQSEAGLFPPESEREIREIEEAPPDFASDVTWRVTYPYNFRPSRIGRTVVFGTAEYRVVPPTYLAPESGLREALANPSVTIATPSRWSAEGFRRLGFEDNRIAVIRHGVDPTVFRPRPGRRETIRKDLGLSGFVFMNVGAMTGNKGLGVLLKAFAAVAERRKDVKLLLKGSDQLYPSEQLLQQALDSLTQAQANLIVERLVYGGQAVSMERMSVLYQAADAYVAPYSAEGFNLPVLEAAACGLPVICTQGGSTEDFVTDAFAWKINSRVRERVVDGEIGSSLEPDLNHLVELMSRIVDDGSFRAMAASNGPRHAVEHFTWDHAVEKMMLALFTPP
jgi:glycosyltransferase involved in cell wall biosynthesis